MAELEPSPQTTLLILLGASSWPYADLPSSKAFENVIRDLRIYFVSDSNGFPIPERNILDLFNSDEPGPTILKRVSIFLKERLESSVGVRDILVYFVGHGGISSDSSTFYLAIHHTEKNYEKGTSITIDDLADRLKKGARFQRRILILDCCFSARALRFLLGTAATELTSSKTIAAFEEKDQGEGFPSRGMSFLASSGKNAASVIVPDETSTMFTSALLSALRTGDPFQKRERLSLRTVHRLTLDFLHKTYGNDFPWPELHSPDQIEGDVANIPFFPNPPAEKEKRRQAEELEQSRHAREEQDHNGPSRIYDVRPRSNRTGRQSSPKLPLPSPTLGHGFDSDNNLPSIPELPTRMTPQVSPVQPTASSTSRPTAIPEQGFDSDDDLPFVTDLPTQMTPQTPPVQPAASTPLAHPSRELQPPQGTRRSGGLPSTPLARRSGELSQGTRRSGAMIPQNIHPNGAPPSRPPTHAAVKRASRRRSPVALLSTLTAIILIAIIFLLYWLLPKAIVTVVLPSQNYSVPVKLIADPNSQTNAAVGTVQETTLKKDFTISGIGKATGSIKVGTASATGTVFFTNNGDQQITIPSNIVLSTSSGIQFVTQINIALGPKNSPLSRQPSFIQAQVSGDSGNVPAGSITIIPAATKNQIEQYNSKIPATAINLQVTNDDPTAGGGVGNAISVLQKDLDATQAALSAQLQNSVNTWLQQQLAPGDVAGKPLVAPTLTSAPKVDTIEESGTFPATLKQTVEVAVVRSADLRSATIAQLNAALRQDKNHQNYQIASGAQQALQIPAFTPVSNGLSMTLNFKPTGEIIQKIAISDVQRQIVNKSPANAEATLKNLMPVIQTVQVKLLPSWLPLTPIRSDNISVQFVAGSPSP